MLSSLIIFNYFIIVTAVTATAAACTAATPLSPVFTKNQVTTCNDLKFIKSASLLFLNAHFAVLISDVSMFYHIPPSKYLYMDHIM